MNGLDFEEWKEVEAALDRIGPGESVTVRGKTYSKPMQSCVNCDNLTEHRGKLWCWALEQVIRPEEIDTYGRDCEFWEFRVGSFK